VTGGFFYLVNPRPANSSSEVAGRLHNSVRGEPVEPHSFLLRKGGAFDQLGPNGLWLAQHPLRQS
jgi:hypothetical protein